MSTDSNSDQPVSTSSVSSDIDTTQSRDAGNKSDSDDSEQETDDGCIKLLTAKTSTEISTVGIVEWATTLEAVEHAHIDFGLDTNYGFRASVDPDSSNFRTLLLGMKPRSTYHYKIFAENKNDRCTSSDHTITTGGQAVALPDISVKTEKRSARHGGFTITTEFLSATPIIVDSDGEYVWWFRSLRLPDANRARMSADGKYMLAGNVNVGDRGTGAILKIAMDGSESELMELPDRHHDFTVLPTGEIALIEFEKSGLGRCDRIVELNDKGQRHVVYTVRDDFRHHESTGEWCHSNAINYVPSQDAYYLSVLAFNAILKIDRASGTLSWVLGGVDSTFDVLSWRKQHQHHVLSNGNILLFNNGAFTPDLLSSFVLEFEIDENTAELVWTYEGNARTPTFGDVQRLGNGNTMVTYSNVGIIQEIETDSQEMVQVFTFGDGVGYATRRDSLYGLPQDYR